MSDGRVSGCGATATPRGHLRPAWRQPLAVVGRRDRASAGSWSRSSRRYIAPHDPLAQDFPPSQSPSTAHSSGPTSSAATCSAASSTARASRCRSRCCSSSLAALIGGMLGASRRATSAGSSTASSCASPTSSSRSRRSSWRWSWRPCSGAGLRNAVLAIVIVAWPSYARVVRGLVLSVGDSEYVAVGAAARRRRRGARSFRDVAAEHRRAGARARHARPRRTRSCCSPGSRSSASARSRPTPSGARWSRTGAQYFQCWWIGTFPGLAIFTAVLAFNFLGDSLRDVFDPQTSWRGGDARSERAARGRGAAGQAADARTGSRPSSTASTTASSRRRSSASPARAAAARRSRCWRCSGCSRRARSSKGARASAGRDLLRLGERELRDVSRPRDRDGLPGSDDVAAPDALDRPAADRARAPPPRPAPCCCASTARSSCSTQVRIPDPEQRAARVSASVLRRHAAADRDRDRARVRARSC